MERGRAGMLCGAVRLDGRAKQTGWLAAQTAAWECPHLSKATAVPIRSAAAAAKPRFLARPLASPHWQSLVLLPCPAVVARVALHSGRWPVTGLVDCLWMCSARRADGPHAAQSTTSLLCRPSSLARSLAAHRHGADRTHRAMHTGRAERSIAAH
jgi:hypothetical protein